MKTKITLALSLFLCFTVSCQKATTKNSTAKKETKRTFVLPEIPTMLTSPEEKGTYLAMHYFENFDFNDTTLIHLPDVGEQGIVDFMDLIKNAPQAIQDSALAITFRKASVNKRMYAFFWEKMDKYLNDPNSPLRNENLYISVCQSIVGMPKVDEQVLSNATFNLAQAKKNRPGMPATDFRITFTSGKNMRMKDLKGNYLLLFFYEPDCHTCIEAKKQLRESQFLNSLIQQSIVTVLAFYPFDDKKLWLKWLHECSSDWVNGYDSRGYFSEKTPYFVRAYPTYYLLDENKTVLLKDAPIEVVFNFIQSKLQMQGKQ